MSEENTNKANDKIVAFMDKLEIVKFMKANQDINHTSSDGQKYNLASSIDSTNAGYSFKYFTMGRGVVVYTFIDESHRLFHFQVINVNERESGYVIDGLLNNGEISKTDKICHSVDTFGFNIVECINIFIPETDLPTVWSKCQHIIALSSVHFFSSIVSSNIRQASSDSISLTLRFTFFQSVFESNSLFAKYLVIWS